MRSAQSYPESPKGTPADLAIGPTIGFELIKALFPRGSELHKHVLALELPQLSKSDRVIW